MTRRALPYRSPSEDVVDCAPWKLVFEDSEFDLPGFLPDWDYQMNLRLRRSVRIDVDRARAESGLPPNAALTLAAVWTATGSNLRAPGKQIVIDAPGPADIQLEFDLPGAELGGTLILDTSLVLAKAIPDARPAAPRRAGSVLWNDRHSMRLQGDYAQFPVAVIDFVNTSFPDEAAWHLQVPESLQQATMGKLLLLINKQNVATATAFESAGNPSMVDKAVLSAVKSDVTRTMIEHALCDDEFCDDASFPDDTWGATLTDLFYKVFPERSINDVRLHFQHSPSVFASDVQAALRIFEDLK
ncbi:hypothetical protein [Saccharopolyspora shandongensis]|uniref:hypothetical protein n=1 Tax=Saccharopolyspora shandongensis TaxID=418495 RepID=UPI003405EF31